MKKVYSLFLALCAGTALSAQVSVSFTVDMTGITVDPAGVHLAGNFNDPDYAGATYPTDYNAAYPNWDPAAIAMVDLGGGLWNVTLQLQPATYEFKFINGNNWPGSETVPTTCRATGTENRFVVAPEGGDFVDYTVCWQSCAACGVKTVRFRVDMSLQDGISPNGVHVAGDFQSEAGFPADWDPATAEMTDPDGNGVYEAVFQVGTASTINFKFVNGNDWVVNSIVESIPAGSSCGDDNRIETLTEDNVTLPIYCFGQCGTCVAPQPVTFRVDMANETVEADGVHVAGDFAASGLPAWQPGALELTQVPGTTIYETVLNLSPGTYPYKFINGDTWDQPDDTNESLPSACNVGGNRSIVVGTEPMTVQFCYNQCSESCIQDPAPADITFFVEMADVTVDPAGVFLIGDFTTPQWQGGAVQMQPVATGSTVYSATVTVDGPADIKYKFVNGAVSNSANEENTGIVDCGIANGIGGFNRSHTRTGQTEVLPGPCFNTCQQCFVGVEEQDQIVQSLNVFPNPATDDLNVVFTSPVMQNLNIRVINNMGQVVSTQTIERVLGNRMITLNVSAMAAGIYNLEIQNGTQSVVRRISVN